MRKFNENQPEQRTADWHRARLGHFTGSQIVKLMGTGRKKDDVFSATAVTYIFQVASERLLSEKVVEDDEMFWLYLEQVSHTNRAMQWGIDNENEARELYEKLRGCEVRELSSVEHESVANYAASPDGVVEKSDICVEIKCPKPETAVRYMANISDGETLKEVMPDYYWQVQAEMDCTGASGCDFVVYCPFLEKPMHIVRIERNDEAILKIHERISLAEKYISENIIKNKNSDKDNGDNRSCEVGDADAERDKPKRKGVAKA